MRERVTPLLTVSADFLDDPSFRAARSPRPPGASRYACAVDSAETREAWLGWLDGMSEFRRSRLPLVAAWHILR